MGSSSSKKETSNIDRIKDIDEDELDLSNIDRIQIKALKELNEKIIKMEKEKSDKIYYKLPAEKNVVIHYFRLIIYKYINI